MIHSVFFRKRKLYSLIAFLIISGFIIIFLLIASPVQKPRYDTYEPLVIASGSPEYGVLTLIADERGYFKDHGLNVTLNFFPTGVAAVHSLLAGDADLAYAAEFVGVGVFSRSSTIRIIACTAKTEDISLVIRNDRNIRSPADLTRKNISVIQGSVAEFFLGRYLTLQGYDIKDVRLQYFQSPSELVSSLVAGDSDAAIIWEPYINQMEQKMGNASTTWPAQSGQRFYWLTYTTDEFLKIKPDTIHRYLAALVDAEEYRFTHEEESKELIAKRLNVSRGYVDSSWNKTQFLLSLDQGLILAMEDESRWMVSHNMAPRKLPYTMLDVINESGIREIRPQTVTIIR